MHVKSKGWKWVLGGLLCLWVGTTVARVLDYHYDALNRLVKLSDADGVTVEYTYDAAGNLLQTVSYYVVAGIILDEHQHPLAGVSLQFNGQTTQTDVNGYYQFNGIDAGQYTLILSKTGYATQTVSLSLPSSEASFNFTLAKSSTVQPLLIIGAQVCANQSTAKEQNQVALTFLNEPRQRLSFDPAIPGKGILLATMDFDADNSPDIVVSEIAKGNTLTVFNLQGQRIAALDIQTAKVNKGLQVALGSADSNGRPSMLIASQAKTDQIDFYQQEGSLLHTVKVLPKMQEFTLITSDIQGDERKEILLALTKENIAGGENVFIFNSDGELTTRITALSEKNKPTPGVTLAVGDVNGDSQPELVIGDADSEKALEIAIYTVQGVLLNRWTAFQRTERMQHCPLADHHGLLITAGDTNGDGKAEVIVSQAGEREVSIFSETGVLLDRLEVVDKSYGISDLEVVQVRP